MTKTQMMCFQAALETKRHELMREIHARAGRLAIREDGCDRIDEVQSMNQRDEAVLAVEWLAARPFGRRCRTSRGVGRRVWGVRRMRRAGQPQTPRNDTLGIPLHRMPGVARAARGVEAGAPAWALRFDGDREIASSSHVSTGRF